VSRDYPIEDIPLFRKSRQFHDFNAGNHFVDLIGHLLAVVSTYRVIIGKYHHITTIERGDVLY
jgi:hypothetical protein